MLPCAPSVYSDHMCKLLLLVKTLPNPPFKSRENLTTLKKKPHTQRVRSNFCEKYWSCGRSGQAEVAYSNCIAQSEPRLTCKRSIARESVQLAATVGASVWVCVSAPGCTGEGRKKKTLKVKTVNHKARQQHGGWLWTPTLHCTLYCLDLIHSPPFSSPPLSTSLCPSFIVLQSQWPRTFKSKCNKKYVSLYWTTKKHIAILFICEFSPPGVSFSVQRG